MKAVIIALVAGMVGCASVQPVLPADAVAFQETVLWSFGSGTDGQYPYANLIDVNGILYGTTGVGGRAGCGGFGCGTVFSLDPSTGAEKVLYSFCRRTNCRDGALPVAGLINVNDTLYGTTGSGGRSTSCGDSYGCGTVFALDPYTGAENVRYSFCSYPVCADGVYPDANLIALNGTLYGTTRIGGTGCVPFGGCGTVFLLDPSKRGEKVLHSFGDGADGFEPIAGLIAVKGTLFGTTPFGGNINGDGTAFSIDLSTGTETVLHDFGGTGDGRDPWASLIDVNGILYGTTSYGGSSSCGCGTVFSLDPGTGAEKVLYSFVSGTDGGYPQASLIENKGTLYGTTYAGGDTGCDSYGCGTVFSLNPGTGAETVLYSFCGQQNCTDGATPNGSLIAVNGNLYGTTESGGAYGYGTVFMLKKKR